MGSTDVFISFSHLNQAEAEIVSRELRDRGLQCFLSKDSIRGGELFPKVLAEAIRECRVFIVLLSRHAETSTWVAKELTEAINLGKTIIPFQLEAEVNGHLAFMVNNEQWITGFPGPTAEQCQQLADHAARVISSIGSKPNPGIESAVSAPKIASGEKVSILYKRGADPDERLVRLFEEKLKALGYTIFIDRHIRMGVAWAQEIERQIRESDFVIALISDRAAQSEMVLFEVQLALEEQDRRGKPHVLPIRIQSEEPAAGELGNLLNRLHFASWLGPQDDERVLNQTIESLTHPPEPNHEPVGPLEQPGGAVPLDSPYYIARDTDDEFIGAMSRFDSIVLVKGGRQMGKTSLLARGLQDARDKGNKVVLTDFQTFSSSQLASDESLYKGLANAIAFQLGINAKVNDSWSDYLGANTNLEMFLQSQILEAAETPIIWALDEVDRLFTAPYATDFFGMVRSWHNRRALEPRGPFSKLTVAIAYATEAHLFITDLNQSPFNVGTRITLSDFSLAQVEELNRRYGHPLAGPDQIKALMELVGGQPYLVRRAMDELARRRHTFDEFMRTADSDEGVLGDHLRRVLVAVSSSSELLADVKRILNHEAPASSESFYRLRSAGILMGDSPHEARFRCGVYARFLGRHIR